MDLFIIILIILIWYKSSFSKNQFSLSYLNKDENPLAIRGIFAVLIFLSHSRQYLNIDQSSFYNKIFILQGNILGQLIVSVFLFYSGFGIMESYKKNQNYFQSYPKKRILTTLINFDIAIILYLLLDIIIGKHYQTKDILLSFIGYTSVGNSNWYIFAILYCYIIVYLSQLISKNPKLIALFSTILLIPYLIFTKHFQFSWWYDTIFTFAFGLWFSIFYEQITTFLTKNNLLYYISLLFSFLIFTLTFLLRRYFDNYAITSNFLSIIFVTIITLFSLKVKLSNPILKFLGKHSFNIYILQRIPMILLSKTGLANYNIPFIIVTFSLTILIALAYNKLCSFISKKINHQSK